MDLVASVTGHTIDVARNCYLFVNRETPLATTRKIIAIYGIVEGDGEAADGKDALMAVTSQSPTSITGKPIQPPRALDISIHLSRPESERFLRIINGEI